MTNQQLRARTAILPEFASMAMTAGEQLQDAQLSKGFVPNEIDSLVDEAITGAAPTFSDRPLTDLELSTLDTWFVAHPEKIAGIQIAGSGFIAPVRTRGNMEDLERVFAFLDSKVEPRNSNDNVVLNQKFKSKEELARAFENETGDAIQTAKLKMAGIALRNGIREEGNDNSPIEQLPYNTRQLEMIDLYDSFGKKSYYLFHSTPIENIPSIQREGLVVGKKAKFEGVSSPTRISLSANEEVAKYYGKEGDAILRVRKGKEFSDLEPDFLAGGEGVYTTGNNIPPEDLEIKDKNKWIPLVEYKSVLNSQTANEQPKTIDKAKIKAKAKAKASAAALRLKRKNETV